MKRQDYNNLIKAQYAQLTQQLEESSSAAFSVSYDEKKKAMSSCPFCQSSDVAKKYRDVNGEMEADASSYGGLFFSSSSASARGKIKTDAVMFCKQCKNEWKIPETDYKSKGDILRSQLYDFYRWVDRASDEVSFNKNDPSEEYSSKEEKQEAKDKQREESAHTESSNWCRQWYPDTIRWALKNTYGQFDFYDNIINWSDKTFYAFGFKHPPEIDKMPSWFSSLWNKIFK